MDASFASEGSPAGEEFASAVGDLLHQEKAERVRVLDVAEICDWTRYVIIATVQSRRQLSGLVESVEALLERSKKERLNKRPALESDWVVYDCGDAVIHLFLPTTRSFYDLDRLYHGARVVKEFP